jgi:hypothetical protein
VKKPGGLGETISDGNMSDEEIKTLEIKEISQKYKGTPLKIGMTTNRKGRFNSYNIDKCYRKMTKNQKNYF